MDPEPRAFVEIYRRFLDEVVSGVSREAVVAPLGQAVLDFL